MRPSRSTDWVDTVLTGVRNTFRWFCHRPLQVSSTVMTKLSAHYPPRRHRLGPMELPVICSCRDARRHRCLYKRKMAPRWHRKERPSLNWKEFWRNPAQLWISLLTGMWWNILYYFLLPTAATILELTSPYYLYSSSVAPLANMASSMSSNSSADDTPNTSNS